MSLIVQKFGGSSVKDAQRIRNVAGIIAETYLQGNDVIVVLSAQGDTTDDLIAKAEEINRSRTADSIPKTISSACVVTWFNPQALIDGTMMLGAFYVTLPAAQSTSFISGVALASCLWFTGLTLLISLFSDNFTPKTLVVINKVCGVIIVFYGCKLLYSFLTMVF